MKRLACLCLLVCATIAQAADPATRLATLEAAHNRVQLEQQAVYQQFMMAQEMVRSARQSLAGPQLGLPRTLPAPGASPPIDYDENQRLQQQRELQLQVYERDVTEAYARYLELGRRKQALLEQLLELSQEVAR